ncbi:DUF6968 family protein [Nocardia miyunensis]|uniref:DUF6968 family protein n=1 Tax=Nocardia miyunensis TaxID=282684 RepID=UPI0008307A32|nr:hypothetical protein [Nocardia miyunensis]
MKRDHDEYDPDDFGEFGHVFVSRAWENTSGNPVFLDIAVPRQQDSGLWVCPFRITGFDMDPILSSIAGADSIQALLNTVFVLQGIAGVDSHPLAPSGDFRDLPTVKGGPSDVDHQLMSWVPRPPSNETSTDPVAPRRLARVSDLSDRNTEVGASSVHSEHHHEPTGARSESTDRAHPYVQAEHSALDQEDPGWLAWVAPAAMDAQLVRLFTETIPNMPGDPWSADGLDRAERYLLERFPDSEAIERRENLDIADQLTRFIGEVFARHFEGAWRNTPGICQRYPHFGPAVEQKWMAMSLDAGNLVTATLDKRWGDNLSTIFDSVMEIYTAWIAAGRPSLGGEVSNDQLSLDLGDIDMTPVDNPAPPGPAEWRRWYRQMDTQLDRFSTETIPELPQPIWSTDAIERVAAVFDDMFPDTDSVSDPSNADRVDQFIRWFGECSIHYHPGSRWWYSPYGPTLRTPEDHDEQEVTTVRFWVDYAAEYGFDHVRFLFRPDEEEDDDEYEHREQQRNQAAATEFRRYLATAAQEASAPTPWGTWIDPRRRAGQVREFLDHVGWTHLPPQLWDDHSPHVEQIGDLLSAWFPTHASLSDTDNADRADQVVCFLGECLTRYAPGHWFDRRQHNDMHLVYMGEKSVPSLYDDIEPAIAVQRSSDPEEPPYTYVAGALLARAVRNFADMIRFIHGLRNINAADD